MIVSLIMLKELRFRYKVLFYLLCNYGLTFENAGTNTFTAQMKRVGLPTSFSQHATVNFYLDRNMIQQCT